MKALVTFVLLALPLSVMAQEKDSSHLKTGSYMSLLVYKTRSLTELNRQLQVAGHAPLVEALIGLTLGTTHRFADQNSYGASRASWLIASDDAQDERRSTTLMVWELAGFGYYDLLPHPKWLAYPSLGFGASYGRLVVSAIEPSGTFQNSLNALGDEEVVQKKYGTQGLMLFGELGVGLERMWALRGSDLYLGLGSGYRLSTQQPWVLKGVKSYGDTFSTQGWTFELKVRLEAHPVKDQQVSRGLFKYFK